MLNYIPDQNRFKLSGPPLWFLRQLWDFDSSLVIIPSRQAFVYRLAQRRKLNLPDHITSEALFQESDTQMLASYGLVPVTSIIATANWSSPLIFVELANRAPHRQGGAEAVNARLDAQEQEEEAATQATIDANLNDTAKDAWGLYLKKIGLRSHMWVPRTAHRPAPLTFDKAPALKFK